MRFSTFRYLLREGFRSLAKNSFMAAASVLVLVSCLLITGCAYLVFENIDHGFDWAYQQNVVVVYSEAGATEEVNAEIRTALEAIENVEKNKIQFVSKEELLNRYSEEFGELLTDLENDNPLPDSFVVSFKDLAAFDATVEQIEKIEHVESVDYNSDLSATLVKVRNLVLTVGVWVVALLLLVSLFIIANTIKLTVYSRRLEIFIMRSVGATRAFIRFPFMVEGLILGCFAGGLSYGLVFGLYTLVGKVFTFPSSFELISFGMVWWQLLLGFVAGGVVIGLVGSCISTGRYLKEQTE